MSYIFSNLRVLMAERRLNIQDIKKDTTLSRTTISNLVNNNVRGVQFDTVVELCELLRCDIDDLFTLVIFKLQATPIKGPDNVQFSDELDNKWITFKSEWEFNVLYHEKKMKVDLIANVELIIKNKMVVDLNVTLDGYDLDNLLMYLDDEYYLTIKHFEIETIQILKEQIHKWLDEHVESFRDPMGILITYIGSD